MPDHSCHPTPERFRQGLCVFDHRRAGVHPEDEITLLGPGIKVFGQTEVRVASQADTACVGTDQLQGSVDPRSTSVTTDRIARTIHLIE